MYVSLHFLQVCVCLHASRKLMWRLRIRSLLALFAHTLTKLFRKCLEREINGSDSVQIGYIELLIKFSTTHRSSPPQQRSLCVVKKRKKKRTLKLFCYITSENRTEKFSNYKILTNTIHEFFFFFYL